VGTFHSAVKTAPSPCGNTVSGCEACIVQKVILSVCLQFYYNNQQIITSLQMITLFLGIKLIFSCGVYFSTVFQRKTTCSSKEWFRLLLNLVCEGMVV